MATFGKRSNEIKSTLHHDLSRVLDLAIDRSPVDFGLHDGARLVETQQKYFNDGKSRIDPSSYPNIEDLAIKAKHIVIEGHPVFGKSRAVDLHASENHNGNSLAWDDIHISMIAGVIVSCAKELFDAGEISHLIRWGGDWDSDGVIALDQRLKDFPHFELIKP